METTRRAFLGAIAVAPALIGAEDRTGSQNPILGAGEHTYECIHDWGQLPSGLKYGNTHSVCEDAQGHIYVHHSVHASSESPDAVVVFDEKGRFVRSFGAMFRGGAHGMHYSREGSGEYLYFCDEKHGLVTKRTLKGEEVWSIGYPQDAKPYEKGPGKPGLNYRPTNIALAANGDFRIVDGYGSYYIFHYTQKRGFPELLNTFGGRPADAAAQGPAPINQTNNPHGIWLDTRNPAQPTVLVADRGNRRIVRYTTDDQPIDIVEGTLLPCHFHQRGDILVVPDLQSRVTLLDKDNKVIAHLGDGNYKGKQNQLRLTQNRADFEPGKFVTPHGAWFDHAGNIFVAEWVEIGRVTKLRKLA